MLLRDLRLWLRLSCRLRIVLPAVFCWFGCGSAVCGREDRGGLRGTPLLHDGRRPGGLVHQPAALLYRSGDLSSSVNHAAADALVAAAANVWNVPTASLVLSRGGALDEHVSGANTFLGPSGLIFPADVQSSNYLAKQIAVIYDSDGSITDLLLGNGASDPTSCLQNGVTESVDSIVPAGLSSMPFLC